MINNFFQRCVLSYPDRVGNFFLFYNWILPLRTPYVRYPLLWRPPTERGIPYHNGIPHRGYPLTMTSAPRGSIPLKWRQPTVKGILTITASHIGVSPYHDVSPQREYPPLMTLTHRGGTPLSCRQPKEGVSPWHDASPVSWRHPIEKGISLWVIIFFLQCLSYVYMFDDGFAPGSQWSVLMMEVQQEFLFSSFDGEITVP